MSSNPTNLSLICVLVLRSNVQGVMDGELDVFVHAWLRAGGPTSRKSAGDQEFGDE